MKLIKLNIVNFKKFKDVTINFNSKLNILTGYNNSGKTTILEAISLWNEFYVKLIHKTNAQDKKLNIKKGQFRIGYAPSTRHSYFDYNDIISIRTTSYIDIFHNLSCEFLLLKATIENQDKETIDIEFRLEKANGLNYKIFLSNWKEFDYDRFNLFFSNPMQPIDAIFVSPTANILNNEQFQTTPVINDKILKRDSNKVLRNRIYNLDETKYSEFISSVEYILYNKSINIELKKYSDKNKDINISYDIQMGVKDNFKNISLLGSGSIQMMELLLAIVDASSELNIVLLDEPDSHIHRDIQKRLLDVLLKSVSNIQVFLTTHNESLIRSAKPEHIFHLEDEDEKEYFSILNQKVDGINFGLQPTKHLKVLQSLGSETSLDLLNALESDHLILVEGKTDPLYIQEILDKKFINKKYHIMYWSFDGIDNIFKHIESYKTLFSSIKNKVSLWDKAILVCDRDFLTIEQAKKMKNSLSSKLNIPIVIWDFYTIESVFLTDYLKFAKLIELYLKQNGIDTHIDKIIQSISENIETIVENKNNDIQNKALVKIIKDRRESLVSNGFNRNILAEDIAYNEIKEFHTGKLKNKKIQSLATKDDIEFIIKSVCKELSFETVEYNLFYQLLKLVDISTWFDSWDNLINIIEESK